MNKLFSLILLFLLAASVQAGTRGQLRQGGKFYQEQKYGSALNSYNQILKQNPHDQRALFNAGNAYYRLNEYTQAQEIYQKAAEENGEYAQSALYNLGNAYYRAGDNQKAMEAYKAAILKDPKDKEAVHNLQLILQQQQQQNQDNQNNQDNQSSDSDNQSQQNDDDKGQTPQPQQNQNQNQKQNNGLSKNDADRIMSMAKENEAKRNSFSGQQNDERVEKDW